MAALRAVEAAVRLRSFTAAAAEIGVSQSAVSQAVRQLEARLGLALFVRTPGAIAPTPAAEAYARELGSALEAIVAAGERLVARAPAELTVGCARALLNTWLIPRAPDLLREHPHIRLRMLALDRDGEGLNCDVAIGLARTAGLPAGARVLFAERLVAVATPALARTLGGGLEGAAAPFTRLGGGWEQWSAATGDPLAPSGTAGLQVRETSAILAAAREGQGVALLPDLLCADDIVAGRLVQVSPRVVDRGRAFWIRGSATKPDASRAFIAWIDATIAAVRQSWPGTLRGAKASSDSR